MEIDEKTIRSSGRIRQKQTWKHLFSDRCRLKYSKLIAYLVLFENYGISFLKEIGIF